MVAPGRQLLNQLDATPQIIRKEVVVNSICCGTSHGQSQPNLFADSAEGVRSEFARLSETLDYLERPTPRPILCPSVAGSISVRFARPASHEGL